MHPENWARIARTVFSLDARNWAQQAGRKGLDANLSFQKKSPEYGEAKILKHVIFLHCYERSAKPGAKFFFGKITIRAKSEDSRPLHYKPMGKFRNAYCLEETSQKPLNFRIMTDFIICNDLGAIY